MAARRCSSKSPVVRQIRIGNYEIPSRTYVGRFNFKGGDQQKFVKDLSGGRRGRLHLAHDLEEGDNMLLLSTTVQQPPGR